MRIHIWAIAFVALGFAAVARADDQTVIVFEGDPAPKVKVGDIVRFTQSGAVGRSEVTAAVEGEGKLVATSVIRRFKDGKPLIGAVTKEFDVKAEKAGKIVVKITVKDLVGKSGKTTEYTIEVE